MNRNVILVAETGSDLTPQMANKIGAYLVPMHVSMGGETYDDGAFPPEDVCAYYDRTGKVPQTSAANPGDFAPVFDEIHAKHPEAKILHLAYSAVTTCSYQSAVIAAEDRDYVVSVDTKHVSVGQGVVVREVARVLEENPGMTVEEAAAAAERIRDEVRMCFVPENLDYLRAGGRVSNAAALVGNLLMLHPCIEIIDGRLMAQKKYRGNLDRVIGKVIAEFAEKENLRRDKVYLINTPGLSEARMRLAEEAAKKVGFETVEWVKTGCVITSHGGKGAFGVVGLRETTKE